SEAPWQTAFWAFVRTWWDESEHVTVHTSGSTGTPTAINLAKRSMRESARMTGNFLHLKPGQTALCCLPCDFIAGKMMLVRTWELGLNLAVVPPSGNPLAHVSTQIDFAAMTPFQVARVMEDPTTRDRLQRIGCLIIGGGAIPGPLVARIAKLPNAVYATYGMTETITHVAMQRLNGPSATSYFEALPGVTFSTDDRECLVITAPHLVAQPLVTNDMVRLHNAQRFTWLGRADHVINTGGIKVFPEEVERKIDRLVPYRFFLTGQPHPELGEAVVLIVEGAPDASERNELLDRVREAVTRFERPQGLISIPAFVETANGKVQRKATLQQLGW
ncbi:MAG: AMP-binding protein, partial [Bacteroidota bacterium]